MAPAEKCSFFFFKYALILLNVFYLIVGIILIAVPAAAKASAMFTSLSILGGIVACGVFLVVVAIFGLLGAIKHHQVVLFFYMVFLLIIFLILFSVSIAALAVSESQRHTLFRKSWDGLSDKTKAEVQSAFDCCGFDNSTRNITDSFVSGSHPNCTAGDILPSCHKQTTVAQCPLQKEKHQDDTPCCGTCYIHWQDSIEKLARSSGGVGLFFSFTVAFGIGFTYYFRNRKDPSVNPRAFL